MTRLAAREAWLCLAFTALLGIALGATGTEAQADPNNDEIVHEVWTNLCEAREKYREEYDPESCACLVGDLFQFTDDALRELYSDAARELLAGAKSDVVFSAKFDHLGFWASLEEHCPHLTQALERRDPEIGEHSFVLLLGTSRSKVNPISETGRLVHGTFRRRMNL